MTQSREAEFADFVATREASLRRLAILLCQDWHRADDLVQAAITKLYVHWPEAKAADSMDAYVRAIVVREFLDERRSSWVRRVTLTSQLPDRPAAGTDAETSLDMKAALTGLPPRQSAPVRGRTESQILAPDADNRSVVLVSPHSLGLLFTVLSHLKMLGTTPAAWTTRPISRDRRGG